VDRLIATFYPRSPNMTDTPIEQLIQDYPELTEHAEARRRALEKADEIDRESAAVEATLACRFGDVIAARHVGHARKQAASLRADAEATWMAAIESERSAAASAAARQQAEAWRVERAQKLEAAREAVADSRRSFVGSVRALCELHGSDEDSATEVVAKLIALHASRSIDLGVFLARSRRHV
jgi:hypothetical protein